MRLLIPLLLMVGVPAMAANRPEPARIESFSPQGTIKGIRQVSARFTLPMVALGDPRLPAPFDIQCPASGMGRWADPRTWVMDFDHDLVSGVTCRFGLRAEARTLDGRVLSGQRDFEFNTGGPALTGSLPEEGSSAVDENQVFLLATDTPVDQASLREHAYCEVSGLKERIEVDILAGENRGKVLEQARKLDYDFAALLSAGDAEAGMKLQGEARQQAESLLLALQCRRSLPPDTETRLIWGKGIRSASGLEAARDRVLNFKTRPAFTARLRCRRVNPQSACLPMLPLELIFSAHVPTEPLQAIRLKDETGKVYPAEPMDPATQPLEDRMKFRGPFPEKSQLTLELPADLKDDAGRPLENAARFPLPVRIDEYPPLAKFSGDFGIVERKTGGLLPVTLRNLEPQVAGQRHVVEAKDGVPGQVRRVMENDAEIVRWLRRVKEAGESRGEWVKPPRGKEDSSVWREDTGSKSVFGPGDQAKAFTVPKPLGEKEFEVIGIPLTDSGFYVVELSSPKLGASLLGDRRTRYVATAALVTNLGVHLKWGREGSMVWVTTLDGAVPVAGARLQISDYCSGKVLWQGESGQDGLARIGSGILGKPHGGTDCYEGSPSPLFVSARAGEDLGFTSSAWNRGIQPGDFNLNTGDYLGPEILHTVLDRPLFRAGETVSMKHFLRRHTLDGFDLPPGFKPTGVEITHLGSDQVFRLPLAMDGKGIGETTWAIPREARLGGYQVSLTDAKQEQRFDSARFHVEQFRLPTMKAVIQPPEQDLVNPREVPLSLFLSYLSGGPAGQAPIRLRTLVEPRAIQFSGYEDYVFGGAAIQEGIGSDSEASEAETAADHKPAEVRPLVLDGQGAGRIMLKDLPADGQPAELIAEMEYQDANGELEAVTRRIPLWPAEVNLGIRADGWVTSRDQVRFQVVALDLEGQPVAEQAVRVRLFSRKTYSWRKRLIGGFYAYDNRSQVTRLDTVCEGRTDATGILSCDVRPGRDGEILLQASTRDRRGNEVVSVSSAWVAGEDETWFEGGDTDRMDLIPERKEYQPGETARFQARMPFREATAWVTVEREGVADSFVTHLAGKDPTIEVPLRGQHAPNVFVSALVVRGRVEPGSPWWAGIAKTLHLPVKAESIPAPTALADLGKPAYRLGNAEIRVGWRAHRLEVNVEPMAAVYRPRETAKVRVRVKSPDGAHLPADAEVAVAAVDEALLSLKPNPSWNLLDAMMSVRPIEVQTSTAQMQVVGKRHFGRKAVPHGGGGGRQAARELFDTLLLWKARLPLNGRDELDLDVPLNDSLSAFRVVAVANAGMGLFGTGSGGFRTSQPLMLNSGLPPVVREGDRLSAQFTLRNASDTSVSPRVTASLAADPPGAGKIDLPPQTLEIPAGGARVAQFQIEVPPNAQRLRWAIHAVDEIRQAHDQLRVEQAVLPAVPVRTVQASLEQVAGAMNVAVQSPSGALPGRGRIEVELKPRLGDALGGVRDYMKTYPYACLEQRVSVAIALGDTPRWAELVNQLPVYLDHDGLLKYFPGDGLTGSDVLTSYVLAISKEAGWELPDASRQKVLDGLKGFVAGRILRDSVLRAPDLTLRKLAAIEALARHGEATPEMLGSLTLDPNAWPTSALLDWLGILGRVDGIPDREARRREALQILKARLSYHGSFLAFSTETQDRLGWLMLSGDVNAARLILAALREPALQADAPRLARGALGRLKAGRWDMTTANAWGTLALAKFSERFESVPVTGNTTVTLDQEAREFAWSAKGEGGRLDLPLPEQRQSLSLRQSGTGQPWALIQVKAALPLTRPLTAGFRLERRVEPVERQNPGRWTRGDTLRVTLDLEAQSDLPWVVVDDPVPAGATVLGKGLGRESGLLTHGETQSGSAWLAWEERRQDAYRAYYAFVPKGRWSVSYTVRLNNPGTFNLPATHVEALYAPEAFADYPNAPLEVSAP
jgi:uncharacterized protein YfaS (alpha-2-macroglobulin family)